MDGETRSEVLRRPVTRVTGRSRAQAPDALAVERPLEIRLDGRAVAVTLRTPGRDPELALGLLAGEGVLPSAAAVLATTEVPARCGDEADVIDLRLDPALTVDWRALERSFMASAACGLCGRVHLEALRTGLTPLAGGGPWPAAAVMALPGRVRDAQLTFAETGGLHAAVWCDEALEPQVLREDVGRHNAVDKVCGWLLGRARRPAGGLLWVSGRAGAEIVLKAARAGIPALAAVGAPSALAVQLAEAADMTLAGFLRDERMNLYCGEHRIGD